MSVRTMALCAALLFCFQNVAATSKQDPKYAVVVDAGSTGSRILIFEVRPSNEDFPHVSLVQDDTLDISERRWVFSEREAGGIQSVKLGLEDLDKFLEPLASFARAKLESRKISLSDVPFLFRATGGLRSLPESRQQDVLQAVAHYFRKSGFSKATAEVIDGTAEGIFAWITVNYLKGFLRQSNEADSFGILDMGGASTQITFLPHETPKEHGTRLSLGKRHFDLYSYSHEGLGVFNALEDVGHGSCLHDGVHQDPAILAELGLIATLLENRPTFAPQGNFTECRRIIADHLREQCDEIQECGIQNVYQPPVNGKFIAMVGFAYFAKSFNVFPFDASTLRHFGEDVCALTWLDFKNGKYGADKLKYLATACFEAAFYSALMFGDTKPNHAHHNGLGFSRDSADIESALTLDGQEISWALGIVLFEVLGGRLGRQALK